MRVAASLRFDKERYLVRIQCPAGVEKGFAFFVLLANQNRHAVAAIELFLDLGFDQRTFFLNDDDQIEAFDESFYDVRLKRPDHTDLEQADAKL